MTVPLDVAALLEFRRGLGRDVPSRHDPQPGTPEDLRHVGPDACVLMGEHDDLKPIVGHVIGHGLVGVDHAFAEILTVALDSERTPRVPNPIA